MPERQARAEGNDNFDSKRKEDKKTEQQRSGTSGEEKAAIEAQIAYIDRRLAELRGDDGYSPEAAQGRLVTTKNGVVIPVDSVPKEDFDIISAKDLQELDIPPLEFIVDRILPVGLAILGAPPKSFKSYMCLDMALCVCQGRDFLGFKTKKCGVMYLDLESTRRRPKNRVEQILHGVEAPDNLYIVTTALPLNGGFQEQLERAINQHPDIRVVIIDVFNKIRPAASKNTDSYERDYRDYGTVKELADRMSISILLVTHTTKMKHPDDPFNEINGSAGVMGSIDVAWVLSKQKREDSLTKFYITGRDLESSCYEMSFDKAAYKWKLNGTHEEMERLRKEKAYRDSSIIKTIKKLLEQNQGHWKGTASEIISASQYFKGMYINETRQQVGQRINEYTEMLVKDCIDFSKKETNRTTEYEFTYINPFE